MQITLAANTLGGSARKRLVERLRRSGADVRVVVPTSDGQRVQELMDLGAEVYLGDAADTETLRRAARGSDVLVWRLPTPRRRAGLRVFWNRALDALTETIVEEDVRHVVHLSHYGAWRPTGSSLVDAVREAERRIDEVSIHRTHVRAGFLLENLLLQVPTLRMTGAIYLPVHAETTVPVVRASRVADALTSEALRVDLSGRRVVEVTDEVVSIEHMVRHLGRDDDEEPVRHERLMAAPARAFLESLGASTSWARHTVDVLVQTDRGNVRQEFPARRTPRAQLPDGAPHRVLHAWAREVLRPRLDLPRDALAG